MASRRQNRISPIEALEVVTAHPSEGKPQFVKLADIVVDQAIQVRLGELDEDHIAGMVSTLESGGKLPPLQVTRLEDGKLVLTGGFHRRDAYRRFGNNHRNFYELEVEVFIQDGSMDDALTAAENDNLNNSKMLSSEEKHNIFNRRWERDFVDDDGLKWREMSVRELARRLKISPDTASRWRVQLSEIGQLGKTVGRDGKTRDTSGITASNKERTKKYEPTGSLGNLPNRRIYGAAVGERVTIYQIVTFTCEREPELHIGYTPDGVDIYTLGNSVDTWYPTHAGSQLIKDAAKLMPAFEPIKEEIHSDVVDTTGFSLDSYKPQLEANGETLYQVSVLTTPANLTLYLAYNADGELLICRNPMRDWSLIENATGLMQGVARMMQPPFAGVPTIDTTGFSLERYKAFVDGQRMGGENMDNQTLTVYQTSILTAPDRLTYYLAYNANGELLFSRNLEWRTWWQMEEATTQIQVVARALQPPYEILPTEQPADSGEWQQHTIGGGVVNVTEQELQKQLARTQAYQDAIEVNAQDFIEQLNLHGGQWARDDVTPMLDAAYKFLFDMLDALDEVALAAGYPIPTLENESE